MLENFQKLWDALQQSHALFQSSVASFSMRHLHMTLDKVNDDLDLYRAAVDIAMSQKALQNWYEICLCCLSLSKY